MVEHTLRCSVWSPPNEERLKCNVDVEFNSEIGTTNRGWCLRDNLGISIC